LGLLSHLPLLLKNRRTRSLVLAKSLGDFARILIIGNVIRWGGARDEGAGEI